MGLAGLIGLAGLTGLANATNGSTIPAGGPVKRNADRVPTPAELSKLKFERDKSIQEAYINQQATRSRMMTAVAQQQKRNKYPLELVPNSWEPLHIPQIALVHNNESWLETLLAILLVRTNHRL